MAGLADLFAPEDYDPNAPVKPRNQHVPVKPKGELKKLDAGYYRDMPVMDKVGNVARTLGQAVGYSPTLANRMSEEAKTGIGFVPGVGDALGAVEAKESLLAGDIGKGLLQAGLTAVGVVPGVGDVAAKAGREGLETVADTLSAATKPSIKAYHGSPHAFDRFDMSKVGTGEGAQAYGHGLYFAENEGVAKVYRDNLARPDFNVTQAGVPISSDVSRILEDSYDDAMRQGVNAPTHRDAIHLARQNLDRQRADALKASDFEWFNKVSDQINELERMGKDAPATKGSMYEVDIAADPEHFLDWDKPLSEQSEKVRGVFPGLDPGVSGQGLATQAHLAGPGGKEGATQWLREKGIPGIKYLDAGSRGAAEGSRNYVVFDDKLIGIVKRYGIPAALGAGLITEEMARQMQDQGLGET